MPAHQLSQRRCADATTIAALGVVHSAAALLFWFQIADCGLREQLCVCACGVVGQGWTRPVFSAANTRMLSDMHSMETDAVQLP